ncbi:TPA: biopolymer transporter ExbD [Candidatus Avigastranaerophilus faecigallinarum]|nr:biopolymer transporter ExbD [Candidatus Avigastranaerophilus faecigallinarum]
MAGQRKTFNEINITPLTDIFLVLLIIMMVIAPLLDQQGLNLAVPNMIEVQDEIKDSKLIKVLVTDEDKYMLDDTEIPVSELSNMISEQAKVNTDGLLIMTQDNATHGAVVKLMDEARNSGVTNISITEY